MENNELERIYCKNHHVIGVFAHIACNLAFLPEQINDVYWGTRDGKEIDQRNVG